ncbi:DUF6325 family protein [Jatrophihabitans sp. DSM 45814]
MARGPIEYLLVKFPDNRFRAELVPALINLVEMNTVRILDLVVISRGADGTVASMEIDDLDEDVRELFFELDGEYDGLISDADIELAAAGVEPGSTAVALIWENTWAAAFAEALRDADGEVIANERIPRPVAEMALAALAESSA